MRENVMEKTQEKYTIYSRLETFHLFTSDIIHCLCLVSVKYVEYYVRSTVEIRRSCLCDYFLVVLFYNIPSVRDHVL